MTKVPSHRYSLKRHYIPYGIILLSLFFVSYWIRTAINQGDETISPGQPQITSTTEDTHLAPGKSEDSESESELNTEIASLVDDMIKETSRPPNISDSMEHWTRQEMDEVQRIAGETFSQSLENTIEWESNYFHMVMGYVEPDPSLPSSLKLIIYSRRYAKLLEEVCADSTQQKASQIIRQLQGDIIQYEKLEASGQALHSETGILSDPNINPFDLIHPLTYRINVAILLGGQYPNESVLSSIVEAADTMGQDTNWAAAAYACDKILSSLQPDSLSPEQKAILAEYTAWKASSEYNGCCKYKEVKLPRYDSALRPFDRAASMGAQVDSSTGLMTIECPQTYPVYRTPAKPGASHFSDPTGNNVVAQTIVAYGRRLCNRSAKSSM